MFPFGSGSVPVGESSATVEATTEDVLGVDAGVDAGVDSAKILLAGVAKIMRSVAERTSLRTAF